MLHWKLSTEMEMCPILTKLSSLSEPKVVNWNKNIIIFTIFCYHLNQLSKSSNAECQQNFIKVLFWFQGIGPNCTTVPCSLCYDLVQCDLTFSMSKIRENINKSNVQVAGDFTIISDVYRSFIPNKNELSSVLLSGFQSSPGALKSTE